MHIIRPLTEAEAKLIRELLRSATARREHRLFVIEGPHLLDMAIQSRATIEYCAFTDDAREDAVFAKAQAARIPIRTIPAKLARRISDTEAPQGIFALIRIPTDPQITGDIILALDVVQDPGNVGTLLRTAAWFGVRTVLLGEGSADAYNPKVVRATQGAIFALHIHERLNLPTVLHALDRYTPIATVLDDDAIPMSQLVPPHRPILVLGNEAHGISASVRACCRQAVYIPRVGKGESLNVAASGAIALYQLASSTPRLHERK